MVNQRPSGTLTFLFTDIQGSTPLWEQDPGGMAEAIALHHEALEGAVRAHGGQVFKTVGDECECVFEQPLQAIQAAVAGQRALAGVSWGRVGPLLVRMGMHTGQAQWDGEDYVVAHTFNRVARIMSTAHGGQIVLSLDTKTLIGDQLPPGISLRDLGRHRLKGLTRREHIFQVLAPDLAHQFPPLNSLSMPQHNLPAQVTPFIGREKEVRQICEILSAETGRLLTLTGPGGTGKTRLALKAAQALLNAFDDGVTFVDLAAVREADFVLPYIRRALGLRENPGQSVQETLHGYLSDKRLLLVLDNFEQVLQGAAAVAGLLAKAPGLKIMVTSRSLLRVYGEVGFKVGPLMVPDLSRLPTPQELVQVESIQLFFQHAQAVKPTFIPDSRNSSLVAEIVQRLDGLPLAIELASARVRLLSPQQILQQLQNSYRLLSGGARNLPPRQQTLQNAIDWSYDLLDAPQKILFKRLSVFAGGCSFSSAEHVCNYTGEFDLFNELEKLIDHSLIRQIDDFDDMRFVMLQTIRDYAQQQLRSNGEFLAIQEQHLAYFRGFAEDAQPHLETAEQSMWLDRLEGEHENLNAALRFAIDSHDVDQAVRLAKALRLYWFSRGYLAEGRRLIRDLLALDMTRSQRMMLLDSAGFLARYHGDYSAAETAVAEGLALTRELGDAHAEADSLANMGFVYLVQDRLSEAKQVYAEALSFYEEMGNEQGTADSKIHLGLIAFYEADLPLAERYYRQCLAIWQGLGDRYGITYAQQFLGDAVLQQGQIETAVGFYRESLKKAHQIGFHLVMAASLEGLAAINALQDEPRRALILAGAAGDLRDQANVPLSAARSRTIDQWLQPAWAALDKEEAQAAWQIGQMMGVDDALEAALR